LVTGLKAFGYTFVPLTDTVKPTITSSPANLGVTNGSRVVFTAEAVGTAPLKYQWRRNGATLAGATNATFTINNAQAANAGTYTLVITNLYGSATSDPARLQVAAPFSITNMSHSPSGYSFYVRTTSGVLYSVEYKDDLSDAEWHALSSVTGNGSLMKISDAASGGVPQRFYRVVVR